MDSTGISYVSVPGGVCSAFGGIFWLISRSLSREARVIASAKKLSKLSDLKSLGSGLLVAVTGVVSPHRSFKGEISKKDCVFSKFKLEQHVLRKSRSRPVEEVIPLQQRVSEASGWTITDSSGVHLPVHRASAAHIQCDVEASLWEASHKFKEGNWINDASRMVLELASGYVITGNNSVEKSLLVGTPVTIVGELARVRQPKAECPAAVRLSDGSMLVIHKSRRGDSPFYITDKSLSELITSISSTASLFRWASIGIGSIGIGLLTWKAASGGIAFIRRKKLRARVREANRRLAADRAAGRLPVVLEDNSTANGGDSQISCCICFESKVDAVYTVCGHMCTCWSCSRRAGNVCPICRTRSASIQVYQ